MKKLITLICLSLFFACNKPDTSEKTVAVDENESIVPFLWENATIYFLLVDRFNNGDPSNDLNFGRTEKTDTLRGFMGGDIKGITQKINEDYFSNLGVTALWINPVVEQIHGFVDEGTGLTYGYHGYWTKDWTALDPNFGTMQDLKEMVKAAHSKGIRVLLDAVANHTGPVTDQDPKWSGWVRTDPTCTYQNWETTVKCTLVDNLPDIYTGSDEPVELPDHLVAKWEEEGRLEQELKELDEFFDRTGYPRAPRYYIIKWLVDYIKELGVDGFRVDTAKHTEAGVWDELFQEALKAYEDWKNENPEEKLGDDDFYMVGEVYNYSIYHGRNYTYDGDTAVDFYDNGFKALINFSLRSEANEKPMAEVHEAYSGVLQGDLKGKSVVNYVSSHDDGSPLDRYRKQPIEADNKLLLSPGAAQIYYGDETARVLNAEGAQGDAHLRTYMNWQELEDNIDRGGFTINEILNHWKILGNFRKNHPSIGGGVHNTISKEPYIFSRSLSKNEFTDQVVIAMGDIQTIDVSGVFNENTTVVNYYTGEEAVVVKGTVSFDNPSPIRLIAEI